MRMGLGPFRPPQPAFAAVASFGRTSREIVRRNAETISRLKTRAARGAKFSLAAMCAANAVISGFGGYCFCLAGEQLLSLSESLSKAANARYDELLG